MDWSGCGCSGLVAANDVAVDLVVAGDVEPRSLGDLVDDVADELEEVNEAGEEELDWVDLVGVVHGVEWE